PLGVDSGCERYLPAITRMGSLSGLLPSASMHIQVAAGLFRDLRLFSAKKAQALHLQYWRGFEMRGWSIPMGRLLGVEVRLHFFFALLLGLSLLYTGMSGMAAIRGVSLWLLLLGVVGLREIARAIVCAYHGLEVRSLPSMPQKAVPNSLWPWPDPSPISWQLLSCWALSWEFPRASRSWRNPG